MPKKHGTGTLNNWRNVGSKFEGKELFLARATCIGRLVRQLYNIFSSGLLYRAFIMQDNPP